MDTETDVMRLLASMDAELRPGCYVFTTVRPEAVRDIEVLATIVEPEGVSLVTTREDAERAGLAYDFVAGWITLRAQEALTTLHVLAAGAKAGPVHAPALSPPPQPPPPEHPAGPRRNPRGP